jgi:hypothetical protein
MGNDTSADITLSGTASSVATVYGDAHLVVSGTALTITGGPDPSALVHTEVVQGGASRSPATARCRWATSRSART